MIATRKTDKAAKTIEVDEKLVLNTASIVDIDTPIAKMKEYVTGSDWNGITYYKQIKGEDDTNNPLDVNSNNVAQQYDKINNYVLKVTSPIETDGTGSGTGSGTVLHFKPKVNDMFKAELINGTTGLFLVTEVTVMNYNNRDAYDISYTLAHRENIDPTPFTNIESKVVQTLYFDKESNYLNSSPILLDEEWTFAKWLDTKETILSKTYLLKFKNEHTGLVAYNNYIAPDLVELFIHMSDPRDRSILDITMPPSMDRPIDPVFNAILNRDVSLLKVKPHCFNTHANPIYNTLVYEKLNIKSTSLFGDKFADGTTEVDIEKLVYSYITKGTIDEKLLKTVVESIDTLSGEIQYMIIPILILIIKDVRSTNSSDLRRR